MSGFCLDTVSLQHHNKRCCFVSVLENRKSTDEEIIDKYCFYVRYEIPDKPGGGDWSDEYLARIRKLLII